jgi:hydrogenase-4 component B
MRLLTPLFAGFLILIVAACAAGLAASKRRLAGWIHFSLTLAAAALFAAAGWKAVFGGGMDEAVRVLIGPFGVPFLVDGLAGLFLLIIAVMAVLIALYSIRYMEHYHDYGLGGYYFRLPLFILGMASLVTVDDLSVGFTLAWQIMTIASFLLIRFEYRNEDNVFAAHKYLILMELAWGLIVIAGAVLGHGFGGSLHQLAMRAAVLSPGGMALACGLLLVGFGLKAGVFPLGQMWLPDAHSVAPSPISALLSGVMLKTGIFGLIRVFFFLAPASGRLFKASLWGGLLAVIGVLTLFIGTLQSVKQNDAKRLLAYSSIGQIGYIVLGLGIALLASAADDPSVQMLAAVAFLGALFHVLNHVVFKGLLFLTSGSLLYATGTKDLNRLGGLIRWMPVTAAAAGIASLSISGMPPTSGFASKWTIISSALLAGGSSAFLVLFGIVALFTSAVTLACYVKFFGLAFTSAGAEWTVKMPIREVPGTMLGAKLVLAAICLAQGFLPFLFLGLITASLRHSVGFALAASFDPAGLGGTLSVSLLGLRINDLFGTAVNAAVSPLVVLGLLTAAFLFAALVRKAGGSREVVVPTWLCGYQDLNEKTRFSDRGMFAALKNLFRWTGGRTGLK